MSQQTVYHKAGMQLSYDYLLDSSNTTLVGNLHLLRKEFILQKVHACVCSKLFTCLPHRVY